MVFRWAPSTFDPAIFWGKPYLGYGLKRIIKKVEPFWDAVLQLFGLFAVLVSLYQLRRGFGYPVFFSHSHLNVFPWDLSWILFGFLLGPSLVWASLGAFVVVLFSWDLRFCGCLLNVAANSCMKKGLLCRLCNFANLPKNRTAIGVLAF